MAPPPTEILAKFAPHSAMLLFDPRPLASRTPDLPDIAAPPRARARPHETAGTHAVAIRSMDLYSADGLLCAGTISTYISTY